MRNETDFDAIELANQIIAGRRLKRTDNLKNLIYCNLKDLITGANLIRLKYVGDKADICSIINAKSGLCSENCKYCAQSIFNKTNCEVYEFVKDEYILNLCKLNEKNKAHRFCIVTAGKALNEKEFESAIRVIKLLKSNCNIELCASLGSLNETRVEELKKAGISTYHHNIETSRRNFSNICSTHSYLDRIATAKIVKSHGLKLCCGGILGMGETMDDRIDMAISLHELKADSIPINILIPIKGTPFENKPLIKEEEILRTVAIFRYINPTAQIRAAAGRNNLKCYGLNLFKAGANALITGNMLTTNSNTTTKKDIKMLESLGFKVE